MLSPDTALALAEKDTHLDTETTPNPAHLLSRQTKYQMWCSHPWFNYCSGQNSRLYYCGSNGKLVQIGLRSVHCEEFCRCENVRWTWLCVKEGLQCSKEELDELAAREKIEALPGAMVGPIAGETD